MTSAEVHVLFRKIRDRYFKGARTKLRIERKLKPEDCSCIAFYIEDTVYIYHWLLDYDKDYIASTLVHELVHAKLARSYYDLESNPLVQVVNYHDAKFVLECYNVHKKMFRNRKLQKCLRDDGYLIGNENLTLRQALKYYNIKR